jgi:hypothetical protein
MILVPFRITTFFHAHHKLVYLNSIQFSSHNIVSLQEENDQAFHVTR